MPRNLKNEDTHSSPISRLLDSSAASRATQPVIANHSYPEPSTTLPPLHRNHAAAVRSTLVKRECVLTTQTDETLTRLTELVRRTTGARINASQTVRALLNTLGPAWPRLEEELRMLGPLRLPSNARGNEVEREALEQALSRAVLQAMRSVANGR